jgi:hypothetical protein
MGRIDGYTKNKQLPAKKQRTDSTSKTVTSDQEPDYLCRLKCSIASKEYTYLNVKVRKNSTQLIVGGEFLGNRAVREQGGLNTVRFSETWFLQALN